MRRNLIVTFKPIKHNSVILSEFNHRLLLLNVSRKLMNEIFIIIYTSCIINNQSK